VCLTELELSGGLLDFLLRLLGLVLRGILHFGLVIAVLGGLLLLHLLLDLLGHSEVHG